MVESAVRAAGTAVGPAAEQLTLAAMPGRLFTCTPTRLATFDCPRRYRMTYLDRPAPPRGHAWAHNTVGAAVHIALARWWDLPLGSRTPGAGATLLRQAWQTDGFRDEQHALSWRERAAEWVSGYLHRATARPGAPAEPAPDEMPARVNIADGANIDPALAPVGIERTVATHTDLLAISGRVDRIDRRGEQLVVVDYKTGRHIPRPADARSSVALALYALATTRTLRRHCQRVELHHLPSGTIAAADHTADSLNRHLIRAHHTASDILAATAALTAGTDADTAFPTRPGPGCGWCDLRANCPDGQRAAPARAPWDGLAEAG